MRDNSPNSVRRDALRDSAARRTYRNAQFVAGFGNHIVHLAAKEADFFRGFRYFGDRLKMPRRRSLSRTAVITLGICLFDILLALRS